MSDRIIQAEQNKAGSKDERIGIVTQLDESFDLSVTPGSSLEFLKPLCDEELSDGDLENVVGGKSGTSGNDCMVELGETAMRGGSGDDTMVSILGDSYMDGGEGDDVMHGGLLSSEMDGGDGDDVMFSSIESGKMYGGEGNDTLNGHMSDDMLYGENGNDVLNGGWGDDSLYGDAGDDTLDGGLGDDKLRSGTGDDVLTGGAGADTFVLGSMDFGEKIITDFEPGKDMLSFPGCGPNDVSVIQNEGGTILRYAGVEVLLQGVELSPEEVLECCDFS
jgi:Ca2+-binding RTX toxin-like protein